MQMYWNSAFTDRMLFNASKAYVRQSKAGETYTLLQPVYGLGVINDIFDNITSKCYHHYGIINYDNSDEVIKGLEFVMIELPKFKPSTMIEKKMAVLWLRFLNELKEGECIISEDLLKDEYISQAIALCEEGKFSEAELAAYDYYWDIISTEKSLLATSKTEGLEKGLAKGREEGLEEGMAKGREEGLEEGLAKGREKGLEEGLAKGREKGLEEGMAKGLEKTVVRSFKNGSSIDFIASITDLSNDEIISILRKHNLDG
jgi:predicted transposase/invertase (TIGR01784 family)